MTRSTTSILLALSSVAVASCASSTNTDPPVAASVATPIATATTPPTATQSVPATPARTTTQRSATAPVAAAAAARPRVPVRVRQQVRVVRRGTKPGPFAQRASARPGDVLQLRTLVLDRSPAKGAALRISIASGPSSRLRVRAGPAVGPPSSIIEIRGRGGGSLRVANVRYTCAIGAPTFCPVTADKTASSFRAVMAEPSRKTPVVLVVLLAK